MARWTGTWLSGPAAAGASLRAEGEWRGRRLGLPEQGPGAVASFGRRMLAFLLDAVVSGLVASLWTAPEPPGLRSFIPLAVLYVVAIRLTGQTLGMWVLKVRLVQLWLPGQLSLARAALRFLLLALLVPALIGDRDGRGLHDKAVGTAVVRV
ncbi:MAG: RDD family protein [Frankiaceae bacterium]|nr:RDD family protein [Frankiaceae bacterium]